MNEVDKKIILAMCENDLCISKAAKKLYYDRKTVHLHLEKILNETGLDCRKFYDAIKLLEMVKGCHRVEGDPISRSAFLERMKRTDRYFNVKFDILEEPAVDAGPTWISVKDRLPERSGDVLTLTLTHDGKQIMRIVSLQYSEKWKAFNADDRDDEGFVQKVRIYPHFWMPMPEPPKEGVTNELQQT